MMAGIEVGQKSGLVIIVIACDICDEKVETSEILPACLNTNTVE